MPALGVSVVAAAPLVVIEPGGVPGPFPGSDDESRGIELGGVTLTLSVISNDAGGCWCSRFLTTERGGVAPFPTPSEVRPFSSTSLSSMSSVSVRSVP